MEKKYFVFWYCAAAVMSLLAVTIFLFIMSNVFNWQYMGSFTHQLDSVKRNANTALKYDPMVTMVPKELQSKGLKSKFKVSDTDPQTGSQQAKVVLVLWSDYSSDKAKNISSNIAPLRQDYIDKDLLIVWKDFIDPKDENNPVFLAAIAAHCAGEQNKFWEYQGLLFGDLNNYSETVFTDYAKRLNLDQTVFMACWQEKQVKAIPISSYYSGISQGIAEAPVVYINEEKAVNPEDLSELRRIIDSKLAAYEE